MSRSYRKNPFWGWTKAVSEKDDKRIWHRRYRRACKQRLHHEAEDLELLPHFRELSDPWNMAKDGRGWTNFDGWWKSDSVTWINGDPVVTWSKEDKLRLWRQLMSK